VTRKLAAILAMLITPASAWDADPISLHFLFKRHMAGNGRCCRSRRYYAADVAQTVRFAQARVEQLKEAVATPPQSNAGPVADGRIPNVCRQIRPKRPERVAGAFSCGTNPRAPSFGLLARILVKPRHARAIATSEVPSTGQSSREDTPDMSPKEMADRTGTARRYAALVTAVGPVAGALWTSYDASFPAMGGGNEKALQSRQQTS
jgi:hypothetical protein